MHKLGGPRSAIAILLAVPALIASFTILGPFTTDALPLFSGLATGIGPGWLPGSGTIDPNMGYTAYALGVRAARELLSGALPLWNHFEGLGMPLLGEMQSAALFPPTLLLLLPHGQMIEQATLQALAGVGTYLFLRRFGLGSAAALAGGLLFELNGAFAWLRNAIFMPIAFLPWLFLALETLAIASRAGHALRERWPSIALGAIAAAMAIYAGFPEIVYFYSLLLLLWAAARAVFLPPRRALVYAGDLIAMAVLAALLAAPALIAFGHFIAEAELGGHHDALFDAAILPADALSLYWLPYLYGPLNASSHPEIRHIWGSIGGYLGLMPLLLGVFGAATTWRQPTSWLLAGWIGVAIGVSHGAPVLHAAFLHLPLAAIAAYARYLNPSWIFCFAVLSALGLDRLPSLSRPERIRLGLATLAVVLVIVGSCLAASAPLLAGLWQAKQHQRLYLIISLLVALALLAAFTAGLRSRRGREWLTLCLGLEALTAFLLPIASFPRVAGMDRSLIEFLQRHAGLQRTALASFTGLTPNFGSAFGVPTINYDDLPVPSRTVDYVHAQLDPAASAVMFRPDGQAESPAQREQRRRLFVAHLGGYAQAGTRYLIGDPDLFATPAYEWDGGLTPVVLNPGEKLDVSIDVAPGEFQLRGVLIRAGTYAGSADGRLNVQLCQQGNCAEGSIDLAHALDNRAVTVDFPAPLTLHAAPYQLTFEHQGGNNRVALWSQRVLAGARRSGRPGPLPELALLQPGDPVPVFTSPTGTIFEIANARPYASALGCRIELFSQDRMSAICDHPSNLVRLEVFMNGWRASVSGEAVPVHVAEQIFQAIDLPAGPSEVEFGYAPAFLRPSVAAALGTLLVILLSLARPRRQDGGTTQQ